MFHGPILKFSVPVSLPSVLRWVRGIPAMSSALLAKLNSILKNKTGLVLEGHAGTRANSSLALKSQIQKELTLTPS